MFGLIGHSTSLESARKLAELLDYPEYAEGDFEMWCSAPPQLVEWFTVTSATGKSIRGAYIDSVFVPEMLRRFKTAKRKVLKAMELAQKQGIDITALGGFTSIIFEDLNLLREQQVSATTLEWRRFTTGNTHTAWVICQQVELNAPRLGIDLSRAKVAVVGATGDIGSAVCRWLQERVGVAELLLVARKEQPLRDLQASLGSGRILPLQEALPRADVVVWVASLSESLTIDTASLRRPCLMIDGGYPKNLDTKAVGDGIHVLKGGIVEFHQDIGWQAVAIAADMARPRRQMFACFAEAMLLDFEQLHTNFSWGRNNISLQGMERIGEASRRHGFRSIGLETCLEPKLAAA